MHYNYHSSTILNVLRVEFLEKQVAKFQKDVSKMDVAEAFGDSVTAFCERQFHFHCRLHWDYYLVPLLFFASIFFRFFGFYYRSFPVLGNKRAAYNFRLHVRALNFNGP